MGVSKNAKMTLLFVPRWLAKQSHLTSWTLDLEVRKPFSFFFYLANNLHKGKRGLWQFDNVSRPTEAQSHNKLWPKFPGTAWLECAITPTASLFESKPASRQTHGFSPATASNSQDIKSVSLWCPKEKPPVCDEEATQPQFITGTLCSSPTVFLHSFINKRVPLPIQHHQPRVHNGRKTTI